MSNSISGWILLALSEPHGLGFCEAHSGTVFRFYPRNSSPILMISFVPALCGMWVAVRRGERWLCSQFALASAIRSGERRECFLAPDLNEI